MSLRAKRQKDAQLAAAAPLACLPPDGVAFCWRTDSSTKDSERGGCDASSAGRGGGSTGGGLRGPAANGRVHIIALGESYDAILVDSLDSLEDATAALENEAASRGGGWSVLDGEFDIVTSSESRKNKQRMALLSMQAVNSRNVYAFHFPALFGSWEKPDGRYHVDPEKEERVQRFFAFLRSARVVTWAGRAADEPALGFALPLLGSCSGFWDLQVHVAGRIRAGEISAESPRGLARAAIEELGVALDKAFQLAPWGLKPKPAMIAYAATDVIITERLYLRHLSGELFATQLHAPKSARDLVTESADKVHCALAAAGADIGNAPKTMKALINLIISRVPSLATLVEAQPSSRRAVSAEIKELLSQALPPWAAELP